MCLRLCLRVAKIRTFAPLLVLSLCSETIALLSDFCSAGWRLPPHFYRKASLATPRKLCGVFAFCPTRKIRDFSRGDPVAPCVNSARRSDGAKYAIPSLRSLQIRSHRDPPKRATAGCTHNLRLTPARLLFEAAFSSCNRNDARPE